MNAAKELNVRIAWIASALAFWVLAYGNLPSFSRWAAYRLLGLAEDSHAGAAVEFFFLDVPKVLLLLVLVVFVVGVIRSFFTPERTRRLLAGRREFTGNALAALLGVVTPFCSCSAVPLFIGFVTAGVPLGVTFSFLVAAPMVNEVAVVLLFGLFGWKVTALYVGMGLLIALISGWVIGRLKLERWVEDWVFETKAGGAESGGEPTWPERIDAGTVAVREIVGKVWLYVILGIAVGAGIHGYVPEDFMASIMGRDAWWSVPAAVVVGVPLYSNAAGIIPIVQALLGKGAALGTVLAFMMAVIGLSLPEAVILRRVLKPRLLAVFFGIVAAGIVLVGYIFNTLY
jgi:uncharacterized membrane protein YraQ (UPF0718 family)